ncbi:uncharacterized protein EDB91DRAFT_1253684 [Suillus paluster]|uniref:uncharacterized protein n=1 Tax=Suillus paluster TaxID=48578 RepID=UPI001B87E674|nr:uncharacterized protein EDB91DRAFT_1253684 [Suillus paluster]KAG1727946.1 hypothetical protein EDB91DRAFT_1253684 [Suillus paluster]
MLPAILARRGYILKNYLENILMPGERHATLAKSKGIHNLSIHKWRVLADALKNNSLTVKTVATDALENLMASWFADGQIDRLGLSHLGNTTPPKSCAVSSKRWRLRVFVEVPQAPPSWRLKVIWRHSLDFEPNNSDLIPQITAIRNDEVGVGAIKDGAIDDEEAANDATM